MGTQANRYLYANGSPLNGRDTDGHRPTVDNDGAVIYNPLNQHYVIDNPALVPAGWDAPLCVSYTDSWCVAPTQGIQNAIDDGQIAPEEVTYNEAREYVVTVHEAAEQQRQIGVMSDVLDLSEQTYSCSSLDYGCIEGSKVHIPSICLGEYIQVMGQCP